MHRAYVIVNADADQQYNVVDIHHSVEPILVRRAQLVVGDLRVATK
jgi:hypothetical protein